MNTLEAIAARRSIRKFKDTPIQEELLQKILDAAIQAPSACNRQPWRFIIVQGEKKAEMLRIMREEITRAKARGEDIGSCEWSAQVMEQAPVTVFIFIPMACNPGKNIPSSRCSAM